MLFLVLCVNQFVLLFWTPEWTSCDFSQGLRDYDSDLHWPRRLVRCRHAAQLEGQEFEFTHVLLLLKLVEMAFS